MVRPRIALSRILALLTLALALTACNAVVKDPSQPGRGGGPASLEILDVQVSDPGGVSTALKWAAEIRDTSADTHREAVTVSIFGDPAGQQLVQQAQLAPESGGDPQTGLLFTGALTFDVKGTTTLYYRVHATNGNASSEAPNAGTRAFTVTAPEQPSAPTGWTLAWDEEFDGNALDTSTWRTCYEWAKSDASGCNNAKSHSEVEWYLPGNVSVHDGLLSLTARRERAFGDGTWWSYTSGMVTTQRSYSFLYGRIDIRARTPEGQGLWPALWLVQYGQWPPEIDIVERVSLDPSTYFNVWWGTSSNYHDQPGQFLDPGAGDGWRVYSLEWSASALVWSVDGVEHYRYEGPDVPHVAMYPILNLAVGGEWPGAPDATTPLPASFDIDYVRVYRSSS
jgi:beta-glucanase (GH16 family)